jgi:glycosyltransferase involved in cell wall biosynthesis
VVTIFEATLKLYPEQFPAQRGHLSPGFYLNLYQWSGAHATLVLTSTHAAKMDLIRAYRIPEEKIRVVYLAAPDDFVPSGTAAEHSAIRRKYLGADKPFFLYVGKMTPRRNVPMLMQAFRELKRDSRIPHKLLVIGKNITEIDIQSLARELEITQDFAHVEYIPDDDLLLLYNAAHVFVLPYSYEAVSLPVIEAQRTGLPVITMDAPGLREVSGDAAVYLRQAEVADIREAMRSLATDAGLHRDLSARGLEFSQRFSWRRTAAETLAVLEEAART